VIVRVATVLSAREWESDLVAHARDSAAIRVVVRAFRAQDIDRCIGDVDVVVAGGEVTWVTPACVEGWRRRGVAVIGVAPAGDVPAARLLEAGGADEIVPDSIDTSALVQAIRFAAPAHPVPDGGPRGSVTAVLGPRGAPGITEVAIAYALGSARRRPTLLVDVDAEAPSIAVRLGLPPLPDLTTAADAARSGGDVSRKATHRLDRLDVIVGTHRVGEPPPRISLVDAMVRASRVSWEEVVLDLGSSEAARSHLMDADEAILVVEGSALGIVRAAQLVATWMGPAPALVLNRVPKASRQSVVDAARRWLGLEPVLVIAERPAVRRASARSTRPDRRFAQAVGSLGGER
jgi:MinD superfamily P-loop ATPase